eukprot:TRINITY_DN12510_c0_g2_i1.p1 TRINITY_DN12510_c0_g2~~TRINITY_DN12510_c0_g2_i1.p1  ORF type:complete len:503 (+),score=78.41 TRINITY_DN12510_c0_g2_i1:360-1868(+)
MVTQFKPTKCENTKFLMWAWLDTLINPRCGLLCFDDFNWRLGCKDFFGDNHFSGIIKIDTTDVITLGLSFYPLDESMATTLSWKTSAGKVSQYSFSFNTIAFKEFFPKATLSYIPYPGRFYYLAFLGEAVDMRAFSDFVGSSGAPCCLRAWCITPRCDNCGNNLVCSNSEIKLVPHKVRYYYCSCVTGSVYDINLNKCITISENCLIPCAFGCVPGAEANCVLQCPKPFIVKEKLGDYSACECSGGGIVGKDGDWCRDKKSKSALFWFLVIGLPILIVTILTIFLIWKFKLLKKLNANCCKSKGEPQITSHNHKHAGNFSGEENVDEKLVGSIECAANEKKAKLEVGRELSYCKNPEFIEKIKTVQPEIKPEEKKIEESPIGKTIRTDNVHVIGGASAVRKRRSSKLLTCSFPLIESIETQHNFSATMENKTSQLNLAKLMVESDLINEESSDKHSPELYPELRVCTSGNEEDRVIVIEKSIWLRISRTQLGIPAELWEVED